MKGNQMVRLSRWGLMYGAVLGLCLLAGCAAWSAGRANTRIQHTVVCWLKDPNDAEARSQLLAAGEALRSIPGVSELKVGTPLASTRPAVDSSYDVIFTMSFASNAAYTAYLGHPTHARVVHDVLEPNVERFAIYDFQPRALR